MSAQSPAWPALRLLHFCFCFAYVCSVTCLAPSSLTALSATITCQYYILDPVDRQVNNVSVIGLCPLVIGWRPVKCSDVKPHCIILIAITICLPYEKVNDKYHDHHTLYDATQFQYNTENGSIIPSVRIFVSLMV